MTAVENPALEAFVAQIGRELVVAQVAVRRAGAVFELRHVSDAGQAAAELRELKPGELRALAQFTAAGAFRPLKSAPNLQGGWRYTAPDATALEQALNRLYPGAIADWFAARSSAPPTTDFREFAGRQTGMYRITTMLSDTLVARVARAGCHRDSCLKRRLWKSKDLAPDAFEGKSLIPCLEPCALLLEFARKAMRIEQEEKVVVELSPSDIATVRAAIQVALKHPDPALREGDLNEPHNPRRLRLVLEKLPDVPAGAETPYETGHSPETSL